MQRNRKIAVMAGVAACLLLLISSPERRGTLALSEHSSSTQQTMSVDSKGIQPAKLISAPTEKRSAEALLNIIQHLRQLACEEQDCMTTEPIAEDTAVPEGMYISVQVSNAEDSPVVVSSQLCSIAAAVDQDNVAEFYIHQSCDIFAYKRDGAFRSYSEEYFVSYQAGAELELSFVFPEQRVGGMGVSIYKVEDGFAVSYVFPDSPASTLGLEPGDVIIEVNGETTYDLNLDDFLQLTTGPEGTTAEFRLKRDDKKQPPHLFTRKVMELN